MNNFLKLLIGTAIGVSVFASLGGFSKPEDPEDDSEKKNSNDENELASPFANFDGPLLNDNGPDATDIDFDTRNIPSKKKGPSKKERDLMDNINKTQDVLIRIKNVFEFISTICSNFIRLFGYNRDNYYSSPQSRIQTVTIY